ncbi:hypothetical protein LCGC14_0376800 [marine sediment metagenome]|uniref:Uncharacterized protein n=1 Tax=marine sediment metagenome TaxID=412755 RepID=A0A0F9T9F8_9ZZZZ
MADVEISDKCEFTTGADQVRLTTQTNGDTIHIRHIHLGADAAAALAYLINKTDNHLKIEIKEA